MRQKRTGLSLHQLYHCFQDPQAPAPQYGLDHLPSARVYRGRAVGAAVVSSSQNLVTLHGAPFCRVRSHSLTLAIILKSELLCEGDLLDSTAKKKN